MHGEVSFGDRCENNAHLSSARRRFLNPNGDPVINAIFGDESAGVLPHLFIFSFFFPAFENLI